MLDALDRLGLAENTLVVYTTDHGDLCGGHGLFDKHGVLYDDVVRVPLILRWPARVPAGDSRDAFVSSALDLAATFCRAAGAPVPEGFAGEDLLSPGENRREFIGAMYHGGHLGLYSQRMVRDRRWKYVWNALAEDELYDLAEDPAERRNRAADAACAGVLAAMRRRLVTWMEEIGDRLLNPWTRAQLLEGRTR